MRYKDIECEYCKKQFEENDDAVACPQCGSPHHRECWLEKGGCANEELHESGFVWKFPEGKGPENPLKKRSAPAPTETDYRFKNGESAVICPYCNALNYSNDAVCMKCHKPLREAQGETQPENGNSCEGGSEAPCSVPYQENGTQGYPPNQSADGACNSSWNNGYQGGNNSSWNNGYQGGGYNYDDRMYEYYQRFGGLTPETPVFSIPAGEMAQYIGYNKSGRYIRKFVSMERFGKKLSVSFAAFLFGPLWYFYRKMYKEGLIYLAVVLAISLLGSFCSVTTPVKDAYEKLFPYYEQVLEGEMTIGEFEKKSNELYESYDEDDFTKADLVKTAISPFLSFAYYGVMLLFTFFADNFYKKKILKDVYKTRDMCTDMQSYMTMLNTRGGVSVGSVVIAALLSVACYIIGSLPLIFTVFSLM